jgi:hypothetical protein
MSTRGTVILALAALGSFAVPEAPAGDSVIHACVKNVGGGLRVVRPGEACSPSETPLEWNIQGLEGPVGPQGPPGPPAALSTACSGDVASVTTCPTPETCATQKYPCTPYTCDSETDTCGASCLSDHDCAQGATCDQATAKCASHGTVCKDDFTIQDSNGQVESCIPYKCVGGTCQQQCQSSNDCYDGYTCVSDHCAPK